MDGTDDAQLIITIVDKDSNAINSCPPVTLTRLSPDQTNFRAGLSITFTPDSDIAIRDGVAAMEFRSYYAGKTVIRATSPGLKGARVEITSLDGPKFISGKTPSVKPRPYVRFTGASVNGSIVTLGLQNPTSASSEAPGHSGRLANDGNPMTFWQAATGDTNAWLRVDLERILMLNEVKLTFPSEGNWRYKIEVSDDGVGGWKMVSDQAQNAHIAKTQSWAALNTVSGRFLRVMFVEAPDAKTAALAELEVTGTMNAQY